MKKNISINLFGTLYNIDEDAYNLLESYLQSMQRYFSRQEGGEEIVDDIEHRVAELLWQRRQAGMEAVSIEVVKQIIDTIGNPEEIDNGTPNMDDNINDNDQTNNAGKQTGKGDFKESFTQFAREAGRYTRNAYDKGRQHVNTHHFFRNTDDKVLGGVCSGMVHYFDCGDALVWRLGTVLATILLSCIGIGIAIPILYIVLWLLAPAANTPEDRLRMQGKSVTPENLTQQVMDDSQRPIVQQDHRGVAGGCLKVLLVFIGVLVMLPLMIAAVGLVLATILVGGIGTGIIGGLFGGMDFFPEFAGFVGTCQPMFLTALLCGLLVVGIPVYGIIRLIRGSKFMGTGAITAFIVIWLLAIGLGIACTVGTCYRADQWDRDHDDRIDLNASLRKIMSIGWTMESQSNLNANFADSRSGYGGLPSYAFQLRADDSEVCYNAHFQKEVTVDNEGSYRFQALAENIGEEVLFAFHYTDNGEEKTCTLKPQRGGTCLNTMDWKTVSNSTIFPETPDSIAWCDFSCNEEEWVYYSTDIPHVDAGCFRIEILVKNCLNAIMIRDVSVVKTE